MTFLLLCRIFFCGEIVGQDKIEVNEKGAYAGSFPCLATP